LPVLTNIIATFIDQVVTTYQKTKKATKPFLHGKAFMAVTFIII